MDKSKLVLIAEDDPFISRMYQTKLQGAGLTVKLAVTGREAVEAIRAQPPALLMLDLNMPELTGFEALEELRDSGFEMSKLQIVILTNSSKAEDRDKAKEFGAEYLVKSDTTPRQVLDIVTSRLANASSGSVTAAKDAGADA